MDDNILYYGDNLDILRRYVKDETVDLIYLDPPFNSNRAYNVLFEERNGSEAAAQIQAFDDTWHWLPPAALPRIGRRPLRPSSSQRSTAIRFTQESFALGDAVYLVSIRCRRTIATESRRSYWRNASTSALPFII